MLGALLWFFLGNLHHAARFDDLERMNAYLARGCNVDARDSRGATPLFHTAAPGSVEGARLLLLHGADPQASTSSGAGPLHSALLHRQAALALFLIAEGADVNQTTTTGGVTALHLAAYSGQREVAEALLAAGAAVNALTARGQSPLYLAVLGMLTQGVDDGCLRLLAAAGADPRAGDSAGMLRNARLNDEVGAALRGALKHIGQATRDAALRSFVEDSVDALAEDSLAMMLPPTLAEEVAALSPEAVFAERNPAAVATGAQEGDGEAGGDGPTRDGTAPSPRITGAKLASDPAVINPLTGSGTGAWAAGGGNSGPPTDSSTTARPGGYPDDPSYDQPGESDLPGNLAEYIIQGLSGVLPRQIPSGETTDAPLSGMTASGLRPDASYDRPPGASRGLGTAASAAPRPDAAEVLPSGTRVDVRSGAFPDNPEESPGLGSATEAELSGDEAPLLLPSERAAAQPLTPEDQAALEALIAARGGPEGLEVVRERGRVAELSLLPPPDGRAWSVPREIGRFTALERLSISGRGLREPLPDSMRRLTSLRYLHLAEYPFPALPEGLYALARLEGLYLARCEVRKLSERLGELRSLRSLRIDGTPLSALPRSLGSLRHLERLDVLETGLTTLPASFGRLAALRECRLNGNGLRSLPAGLAGCRALAELDLGRNDLRVVPASLAELPVLESLSLHGNAITGPLPSMLGTLPRLHYLNLSENAFSGPVPDSLLAAPTLRVLILSANPGLSGPLPPCRGPGRLRTLALHETGLTPAPEDMEVFLSEEAETRRLAGLAAFTDPVGAANTASVASTAGAAIAAEGTIASGLGLAVTGVSSPVLLREVLPGWFSSGQRALSLWGGSYALSVSFDAPRVPAGLDAAGAEALARRSLPAVNALLAQLAGMDREALLRQAAEQVFPRTREHLRYGTLEDAGEAPLRNAADLARHLYVGAVSVTIFPDAPPVLELSLETCQQFLGGRWIQVTLENGCITDVEVQG